MAMRRTLLLPRTAFRRGAALAAATTAALALTACGGGDSTPGHSAHSTAAASGPSVAPSAAQDGHNAQDVAFAQQMIPHHRQAVTMAALAPTRSASPQVKSLAAQIRKAQDPEIATMTGWLKAWGANVPDATASGMGDMPGMDHSGAGHSGSSMPGMMSDADMGELGKLSGAAFDRAFLQMMIGHHEGAVVMAKAEQGKGGYRPAKAMAGSIVTSQSAEITEMKNLLGGR
ncbi:DUF305 domain-containing protein [Streptomyces sp. NPDC047017]|uniref:DUF305 domain-containing protein n=1 Tax=Streptomyces sp. NPDC047017 TaxID=3155024 RepID=UPI0033D67556